MLIDQTDLLPRLFEQILIPDAVRDEMLAPDAPVGIQQWVANPPVWLTVQSVSVIDETLNVLDRGEQAAITLAHTLPAELLLIDEQLGRQIANHRGLPIIGTIGLLDIAYMCITIPLLPIIAKSRRDCNNIELIADSS
ncbi:MAG: DUF3368 domain-containing protein [Symploca sp. SIO1A3]|nr:DUF3368 domain-containing protein [Symploca sp. SIO1A3]